MRMITPVLPIVLLLLAMGTFDARAVEYSIVPVSPGNGVVINNYGDITGNNDSHAFMWTYKTRTLQVVRTLGGSSNHAIAINDCGEVVGASLFPGDKITHAFVWYQGYRTDLDPHGAGSVASAINNAGVIVGSATSHSQLHLPLSTHQRVWLSIQGAFLGLSPQLTSPAPLLGTACMSMLPMASEAALVRSSSKGVFLLTFTHS
jgi:probable HAF family extracellular repeat protein